MAATVRYYDIDRENTDSVSLSAYGSYSSLSAIPSTLSLQFLLDNYDTPNYLSLDGNGIDIKDKNKKFYSAGDYVGCVSANVSDGSRQLENCGVKVQYDRHGQLSFFQKRNYFCFLRELLRQNACNVSQRGYGNIFGRGYYGRKGNF